MDMKDDKCQTEIAEEKFPSGFTIAAHSCNRQLPCPLHSPMTDRERIKALGQLCRDLEAKLGYTETDPLGLLSMPNQ